MIPKYAILVFIIFLLTGCYDKHKSSRSSPTQPDQSATIFDVKDIVLPENQFYYTSVISFYNGDIPKSASFELKFTLKTWTEDYGLELFVMTDLEFAKYREGLSFEALFRQTIKTKGLHTYETERYTGGHYRVVVDNTDAGWEDTDWDGIDDIVKFDFKILLNG